MFTVLERHIEVELEAFLDLIENFWHWFLMVLKAVAHE